AVGVGLADKLFAAGRAGDQRLSGGIDGDAARIVAVVPAKVGGPLESAGGIDFDDEAIILAVISTGRAGEIVRDGDTRDIGAAGGIHGNAGADIIVTSAEIQRPENVSIGVELHDEGIVGVAIDAAVVGVERPGHIGGLHKARGVRIARTVHGD